MSHFIKRFIRGISERINRTKHTGDINHVMDTINARCEYRMEHPIVMDAILLDSEIERVGGTTAAFLDYKIVKKVEDFHRDYEKESIEIQDNIRRGNPNLFEVVDVLF